MKKRGTVGPRRVWFVTFEKSFSLWKRLIRGCQLTRTWWRMDSRWFLAGVILIRTASSKLHNSLPLFRWCFRPKTYPIRRRDRSRIHFSLDIIKGDPHISWISFFIMKLVILSTRDIDIELVVMNIAMGRETIHNGATIQDILNESAELQDWFQTLHRKLRCSVIAVNKQHA